MTNAKRTNDQLAALNRGAQTVAQTIYSLKILHEWAKNEASAAMTDSYRERWTAERNAAADAIARLSS